MTGGRVLRVREYLDADEAFCLTYGDGVGDVDVAATIELHRADGAAGDDDRRPAVGPLRHRRSVEGERVTRCSRSTRPASPQINGGFFVVEPTVLDCVDGDETIWERDVLPAARARRPARRLRARRLLAANGHGLGARPAGGALALGPRALEDLVNAAVWRGRRVLVTGHTGFKGAWLQLWLERLGAEVHGLALEPRPTPSLHALVGGRNAEPVDVRDGERVAARRARGRARGRLPSGGPELSCDRRSPTRSGRTRSTCSGP